MFTVDSRETPCRCLKLFLCVAFSPLGLCPTSSWTMTSVCSTQGDLCNLFQWAHLEQWFREWRWAESCIVVSQTTCKWPSLRDQVMCSPFNLWKQLCHISCPVFQFLRQMASSVHYAILAKHKRSFYIPAGIFSYLVIYKKKEYWKSPTIVGLFLPLSLSSFSFVFKTLIRGHMCLGLLRALGKFAFITEMFLLITDL